MKYDIIVYAAIILIGYSKVKSAGFLASDGTGYEQVLGPASSLSLLTPEKKAIQDSDPEFEMSVMDITLCGRNDNPKEGSLKLPAGNRSRINSKEGVAENSGLDQEKATIIYMEIVPELMKFNLDTFTVASGKKIILELDNLDGMQHNLLIVQPGTLEKVGAAADAMLRDPKASEKHYVPDMPEVLFATDMLGPDEIYTLNFTAPTEPGNYPFVCTFPGHWRMMNGIMKVEKD